MKIAEKVKTAAMGVSAVATLGLATAIAPFASAADTSTDPNRYIDQGAKATGSTTDLMRTLNIVINVALGIIGFVAVVMIIFGGIQYTTSAGDATKVTKAKNTILYGIVGLVIALLAFAIVNFVLVNIFK